jgi:hypothetical protein
MPFAVTGCGMLQIFVNNEPQTFPNTPKTWGDLLTSLDAHAERAGVILSGARFDGVEEPSFRAPAAVARPLVGVNRVDVETSVPKAFLRECLLEAIQPLKATADSAKRLGEIYRGHDLKPGHEGLKALATDLSAVAVLADMLDGPLGVDTSLLSIDGMTVSQHLEHLGITVDALVTAQEAEDWLTVADVLEYDLEPAIRKWAALLTMITCNLQ